MRPLMLLALLAVGVATPAVAAERSFPTGGNFDRVANATPFDVYVHTGRQPSVHAIGSDEGLKRLRIENRGGELRIDTVRGGWFSGWNWRGNQRARIDVTVPMVSAVSLAGPGNLNVDNVRTRTFRTSLSGPGNVVIGRIEAETVALNLSGPGDITVAGSARSGDLTISGPGDIHADKLGLGDATISVSGPGSLIATVARTADVRLSGPGDVNIRGGARCSIHKSGPGDVRCG